MIDDLIRHLRRTGGELLPTLLSGAAPHGERLQVTAGPALFQLSGPMPSGWVEVDLRIGASAGRPGRARVIADAGKDTVSVPLSLTPDGSARTVARLPDFVRSLKLELDRTGPLDLPAVRVRELTWAEAAARLAAPVLSRRLRRPWELPESGAKLLRTLRQGGVRGVMAWLLHKEQRNGSPDAGYADWQRAFSTISEADRVSIRRRAAGLRTRFSLLMAVCDTQEAWLARALASVRSQLYPHWQLCIVDTGSKSAHVRNLLETAAREDPRIQLELRSGIGKALASNASLSLATGDFVARLDPEDELAEHALYLLAEDLESHPDTDLAYGDDDRIDEQGRFVDPHFKPDWNLDLLRSHDYIAHLCAMRRERVIDLGGYRAGFPGSESYDLCLRVARDGRVRHVPFVLYHRRLGAGSPELKDSADVAVRVVQEHLGSSAQAAVGPLPDTRQVRWPIPDPAPLVSLIIPTRDARPLLETCVESILRATEYEHFEIVIIDNQSSSPDALAYFSSLQQRGVARVVRFDHPFNFSAINNAGVREARGQVVALLNNDLEAIEPGWLGEMVSHALRPEIGAVGARLLYPDRTVQHGGILLGIGGIAGHAHKLSPEHDPGYFLRAQIAQDMSAVTAACLAIRRETYLAVGGFDETLAVAFNDVDFCLRVGETGRRNLWTPFATLIHHESRTRGADDSAPKRARFHQEIRRMHARWGHVLGNDPAYNPNLTLESEDFALAWPPRVRKPW
ncbi:MAG TPA: glycosyltransferase family 2 protein [Myxococcales bacterium]